MAEKDRIVEIIGLCKLALGVLAAADISLIAWVALHYETASTGLVSAAVIVTLITSLVIMVVGWKAIDYINRLENL